MSAETGGVNGVNRSLQLRIGGYRMVRMDPIQGTTAEKREPKVTPVEQKVIG